MFKKIVSFILVCAMFVAVCPNVLADDTDYTPSVEEILSQYHEKAFENKVAADTGTATVNARQADTNVQTLEQETVNTLTQAGYEAYNVTSSNYNELEDTLQTDLASMGIDPDGSYIVVVSGENSDMSENVSTYSGGTGAQPVVTSTAGSSFTYTLDGKTYTMRYLTVTAADNSYYGCSSSYRIIGSTSANIGGTVLENLLNAAISVALDEISGIFALGTISSICGLKPANFGTTSDAFEILDMYAGTNWTRIFTQIWVESESRWVSQLHVEYAKMTSNMGGNYYDAKTNSYKPVPTDAVTKMAYSEHLDDKTWRIEQAIIGLRNGVVYYDYTGDAKYYYQNKLVITHNDNS